MAMFETTHGSATKMVITLLFGQHTLIESIENEPNEHRGRTVVERRPDAAPMRCGSIFRPRRAADEQFCRARCATCAPPAHPANKKSNGGKMQDAKIQNGTVAKITGGHLTRLRDLVKVKGLTRGGGITKGGPVVQQNRPRPSLQPPDIENALNIQYGMSHVKGNFRVQPKKTLGRLRGSRGINCDHDPHSHHARSARRRLFLDYFDVPPWKWRPNWQEILASIRNPCRDPRLKCRP